MSDSPNVPPVESANPLVRLFSSSKALVVLAVTGACFAALFTGKATWEQIENLLRFVIGPWLLAVGVEDAAKHVASGMNKGHAPATAAPDPDVEETSSEDDDTKPIVKDAAP